MLHPYSPRASHHLSALTLALAISFPLSLHAVAAALDAPAHPDPVAAPATPTPSVAPAAAAPAESEPPVSSALQPNGATGEGLQAMTIEEAHDGMGHLPGHASAAEKDADQDDPHHGMRFNPHEGMMGHDEMGEGEHCDMDSHDAGMDPHHMNPHHMGPHHGEGRHGDPHAGMEYDHHAWMHGHGAHGGEIGADALAIASPPPPDWLDAVELKEEQEDKIFAILHEFAPAQRKAARLAQKDAEKLRHAGMATDYSEAETRKIAEEYGHALADISLQRARMERRILDALDPEQRRDAAHQAARSDD